MKRVSITVRNFYSHNVVRELSLCTDAHRYEDVLEEQKMSVLEYVIYHKKTGTFLSEKNLVIDGDDIVLINANGKSGGTCSRLGRDAVD